MPLPSYSGVFLSLSAGAAHQHQEGRQGGDPPHGHQAAGAAGVCGDVCVCVCVCVKERMCVRVCVCVLCVCV